MRKIYILIIIFSLFLNCKKPSEKSSISLQIENTTNDTVKVGLTPFGEKFSDNYKTIILKNGKITIDTLISEPNEVLIIPNEMFKKLSNGELFPIPSKIIRFFIYPKNSIHINGKIEDFYIDYTVNGNDLNKQYSDYRKRILENSTLGCKLFYEIEDNYAKGSKDSVIKVLEAKEKEVYQLNRKTPIQFINDNPHLDISAYLLANEQKETILNNFDNLIEQVQNSDFGKIIKHRIDNWKSLTINSIAPDFEYQTYKSGQFKLSENNEKYIVLDFWGSWCGPCIMEMPKMREFYKQNKNKVEIIGIAARDKKENWIKAIKENELDWKHILNNKEKDDLVKKYGITGFPTKVIINPNGKIEGIFLGVKDDFFLKMNELLKE